VARLKGAWGTYPVLLTLLARQLGKSAIVWFGGSLLCGLLGLIVSFVLMQRAAAQANPW
jgi:hypothetical protein